MENQVPTSGMTQHQQPGGYQQPGDDVLSAIPVYMSCILPMLFKYGRLLDVWAYKISLHVVANVADFAIILWYDSKA
jgi:hypothetical protein